MAAVVPPGPDRLARPSHPGAGVGRRSMREAMGFLPRFVTWSVGANTGT